MRTEIKGAKRRVEKVLECEVPVFCWGGGEEDAYTSEAAALISRAGFNSFMTNSQVIRPAADSLQVQRANIEADYPLWLTRFQLSGFMDLLYAGKRKQKTDRNKPRQPGAIPSGEAPETD